MVNQSDIEKLEKAGFIHTPHEDSSFSMHFEKDDVLCDLMDDGSIHFCINIITVMGYGDSLLQSLDNASRKFERDIRIIRRRINNIIKELE